MQKVKRKRNRAVTVRMNEAEYADFQNKVEESGLTQQAYIISAVRGATITPSDEIAVLNEPIKIILSKKDSTTSKFIKGAKIVITPEDKELTPLEIETNDKEMELNLVPGIYYIKETEAPEGYEKLEFEYKIEVLEDGNVKLLSENAENISIKDNSIILYNTKVVVEKTGLSISPFTIAGVIMLITAGFVLFFAVKKRYA